MALFSLAWLGTSGAAAAAENTLTEAEKADGWRLLFDGQTTTGWRGFNQAGFPDRGWTVVDGCLKHIARGGGGDIITVEQFAEFELQWEWRLPSRANSGLKYFIREDRGRPIGHEYQLIDDQLVKSGQGATASFYDVLPPQPHAPVKFAPEWNHSRILVRGQRVVHWLNGEQVLAYELGSPEVLAAVARSKFKDVPDFGTLVKGHILLTDHGDECSFRNLKIRALGNPDQTSEAFRRKFVAEFKRTWLNTGLEDAQLLRILVQTRGAQRGVEVGSASGFGAVNMGFGFERNGGHLYTIDIDPEMVRQTRENLAKVGLEKTVTVIEGDALEVLPKLTGEFDFVFLDAVKRDYFKYFRALEPKLKAGAVVVADNAIRSEGEMRDFLDYPRQSPDYDLVIVRASMEKNDGIAIGYKRR